MLLYYVFWTFMGFIIHVQSSSMTLVCSPRRAEHSKAVDNGKAPDGNDPEMGRRGSGVAD